MNTLLFKPTKNETILKGEIKSLTALRFIAALYVAVFHAHNFSGVDLWVLNQFLSNGYLAVDFFFILSGFILAYTYAESYREKKYNHRHFIIKRLARIYPLHLFCLILMCFIYAIANHGGIHLDQGFTSYNDFWQNIFLIHAWAMQDETFNQPSWSISAEFFVYLLFPIFLIAIKPSRPFYFLWIASVIFLGSYIFIQFYLKVSFHEFKLIRITTEFLLGIALYRFFGIKTIASTEKRRKVKCIILLLLLVSLCSEGIEFLVILLFAGLIYMCADTDRAGEYTPLTNRFWNYMGRISYSFYMIHYCIWVGFLHVFLGGYMGLGQADLSQAEIMLYLLLTLALFFPASMLLYHGVEVPARRWIVNKYGK